MKTTLPEGQNLEFEEIFFPRTQKYNDETRHGNDG
jgi:hypothetical protein